MNDLTRLMLAAGLGYLLGSINFSLLVSRLKFGMDIREHGSGNAGATNSLRVLGLRWTIPVALGDILKGVAAALLGQYALFAGAEDAERGLILAACFAVLGHNFPLYFGFRGGKGVVNTAVAIGLIDWRILLIGLAIFAAAVALWRITSIGSMLGAFGAAVLLFVFHPGNVWYGVAGVVLFLLCVFMHRGNLRRLLAGNENKVFVGKKK
jgi:glycerol-3-phosphate acyltransferase PlsY